MCSGTWLCTNSAQRPGRARRRATARPTRGCGRAARPASGGSSGDRVQVDDAVERVVGVLQRHPLLERAEVVAEMERVGRRLDAGEHARPAGGRQDVGAMTCPILAPAGRRSSGSPRRGHAHPRGTAPVDLGDVEPVAVVRDPVVQPRQPAERGHHVAADRRVRALGQLQAGRSPRPRRGSACRRVRRRRRTGCCGSSAVHAVLVADVADDLLDEVLERDDAVGAAVLVDDDARWWPSRRISDSAASTRLVAGIALTSRATSPTVRSRSRRASPKNRSRMCTKPTTSSCARPTTG